MLEQLTRQAFISVRFFKIPLAPCLDGYFLISKTLLKLFSNRCLVFNCCEQMEMIGGKKKLSRTIEAWRHCSVSFRSKFVIGADWRPSLARFGNINTSTVIGKCKCT